MLATINRFAVVIKPKQPYYEWANSFDDGGPKMVSAELEAGSPVFLVPDCATADEARQYVLDNSTAIFEEMLESWMRAPETWPRRDQATFLEWFDFEVHEPVFDLGDDGIHTEDG